MDLRMKTIVLVLVLFLCAAQSQAVVTTNFLCDEWCISAAEAVNPYGIWEYAYGTSPDRQPPYILFTNYVEAFTWNSTRFSWHNWDGAEAPLAAMDYYSNNPDDTVAQVHTPVNGHTTIGWIAPSDGIIHSIYGKWKTKSDEANATDVYIDHVREAVILDTKFIFTQEYVHTYWDKDTINVTEAFEVRKDDRVCVSFQRRTAQSENKNLLFGTRWDNGDNQYRIVFEPFYELWAELIEPFSIVMKTNAPSPFGNGRITLGDTTTAPGATPSLSAWMGYGPTNLPPDDGSWLWTPGTYKCDSERYDVFTTNVTIQNKGTYAYCWRFQYTNGFYLYGLKDGMYTSDFNLAQLGTITVQENFNDYDLEAAWIERTPKDLNPMKELGSNDRPQPGETNWWELHVYNNSLQASDSYTVTWKINGAVAGTEYMPCLAAQTLTVASNRWIVPNGYTYDFTQSLTNIITAEITVPGDTRTNNNALSVFMDALTFQIGVYTGTFWQYTVPGDMSFYERLNILFARLNRKLGEAVSARAPYGILDRYRVDMVYIDPSSKIDYDEEHVNQTTKSYFSEGVGGGGFINYHWYFIGHTFKWYENGVFSIMGMDAFIHEVGHSLQAPDIYNFNLQGRFNYANPGVTVNCTWMNPPGKKDIMNDPYVGEASVFTEYEALGLNLQAGIQRKVTPEMIAAGPGNTNFGYMYRDLPQNVEIKLYHTDGRELEGMPVSIYRGFLVYDGGWPNLCFTNIPYYQGTYASGYEFDPDFSQVNSFHGKMSNCYQVAAYGGVHDYHYVLDFPRFNHMYWLGYTNTAVFTFTNVYATAEVSQVVINTGNVYTLDPNVTVDISVDATAGSMRLGNSEAELYAASWQSYSNNIHWQLAPELGWQTVFVQVASLDYVPSYTASAAIEFIPEPTLPLMCALVIWVTGRSRRKTGGRHLR